MNRHFIEKSIYMCINKHVKRCSKSLVIRKMQMKTTTGHHYWSTRITKTKKKENTKYWWGYGEIISITFCCWEKKVVHLIWKTVGSFLKKKKEEICNCHVTSNYTPGHLFQKNENLGFRKHLHTNVYGSFICIIILKKKREREKTTQMSFNMWLIKQTVVHPTMENYSAIRRSELLHSFNNNYELS